MPQRNLEALFLKLSPLFQEDLDYLRILKRKKTAHPIYAPFTTYN